MCHEVEWSFSPQHVITNLFGFSVEEQDYMSNSGYQTMSRTLFLGIPDMFSFKLMCSNSSPGAQTRCQPDYEKNPWKTVSPCEMMSVCFTFTFLLIAVRCELSEWSPWGPCMKKNKTCGFKKGSQSRKREPMQPPSPATVYGSAYISTCTLQTETRRCSTPKRIPCGKGKLQIQRWSTPTELT